MGSHTTPPPHTQTYARMQIPPALGYGDAGAPPNIPGGSTLIFETELVKIE